MQGPHGSGKCQEAASPQGIRDRPRVAVTLSCLGGLEGTVHSPGARRVSALSRCSGIPRLGLVTCGHGGERSGDEPRAWEWGWTEPCDEAEERPKRWARGWERNMGPEIQNVDLGRRGEWRGAWRPHGGPSARGRPRLRSGLCVRSALELVASRCLSSPTGSPSSSVMLPRPAQCPAPLPARLGRSCGLAFPWLRGGLLSSWSRR